MLLLPTFNGALNPCPVSSAALTPHEKGHYCGQCRRVVHDFTQSQNPVADLAAARAAAPNGRVCGAFSAAQVVVPPPLSRRLRWFVVALVLVVGQGLSAREALAQVQKAAPAYHSAMPVPSERLPVPPAWVRGDTVMVREPEDLAQLAPEKEEATPTVYGGYVEQMPHLRGGGGMRAIVDSIQARVRWPQQDGNILLLEGKVFASFVVEADGQVTNVKTVKSLHPAFDEAVLAAIRGLTGFVPGLQSRQPVAVSFTVPITFKLAK